MNKKWIHKIPKRLSVEINPKPKSKLGYKTKPDNREAAFRNREAFNLDLKKLKNKTNRK